MSQVLLSNVRRVEQPQSIPAGKYQGTWSGNQVVFVAGDQAYRADAPSKVTSRTPCTVRVTRTQRGFKATVEVSE